MNKFCSGWRTMLSCLSLWTRAMLDEDDTYYTEELWFQQRPLHQIQPIKIVYEPVIGFDYNFTPKIGDLKYSNYTLYVYNGKDWEIVDVFGGG